MPTAASVSTTLKRRLPVLAALLLIAATLVYLYQRSHSPVAAWSTVVSDTTSFGPFEDLKTITYSVDCSRAGIDPYRHVCDPMQRQLNYPRVWLQLGRLGFDGEHNDALGWLVGLLAVPAYLLLFSTRSAVTGIIAFVSVLFSMPIWFALERGNTDQVVFSLLVVLCAVVSALPASRRWLGAFGVALLTCLKVYPVVASIGLLKNRKSLRLVIGTGLASVVALAITAGPSLRAAYRGTPMSDQLSFGVIPFVTAVGEWVHQDVRHLTAHRAFDGLVGLSMFCLAAGAGILLRPRLERWLPSLEVDTFRGMLAVCCTAIYCFAFLGGSSYNYRLIYLYGVLGFLLLLYDTGKKSVLPFVLLLLGYVIVPQRFLGLHEICDGLTFLWFSAWLGVFLYRALLCGAGHGLGFQRESWRGEDRKPKASTR